MTIGQLIETTVGKWGALMGMEGDGTPFAENFSLDDYSSALHNLGFQRRGFEVIRSRLLFFCARFRIFRRFSLFFSLLLSDWFLVRSTTNV
jgi:hypothetical protein